MHALEVIIQRNEEAAKRELQEQRDEIRTRHGAECECPVCRPSLHEEVNPNTKEN